ncbi:MAG: MFS transporter [Acidimicrobiia bacterium]
MTTGTGGPSSQRWTDEVVVEETTDALVDGDRSVTSGTAQAALRHRDFRIVWSGTFASNIGTWMQNVLLGAFALKLTGDPGYVGLLVFAQLGPLLFLGPLGGVLADVLDRRRLLIWMQLEQLFFSIVLAVLVTSGRPSEVLIFLCVLAIGVGNALSAPALGAILPTLVPSEDLPGAVSLQSVQMNLSRVIGPAIGAPLYAAFGAATVFGLNALTYLFAVLAVVVARYSARNAEPMKERGLARLLSGFRVAAADPLIRRILLILTTFSFFSLVFVGLMPVVADHSLGIDPKSTEYGLLYAAFGLGAALGAVSVGTLFASRSKPMLVRVALVAFAGLLALFALERQPSAAYPTVIVLGFAYFVAITSLSTVLQQHLDDSVRGRIMALWIMAFGGTVPIGVVLAGFVVDPVGITTVLLFGAAVALALAAYANLERMGAPA